MWGGGGGFNLSIQNQKILTKKDDDGNIKKKLARIFLKTEKICFKRIVT